MSTYELLIENARQRAARSTPNPYRLTKREMHVAAWIGRGLDRNAIAQKLAIRPAVVSGHITRITAKLGARNAVHLVLIINTLPGLPIDQPQVVAIEDFRIAFGMGWDAGSPRTDVAFSR